MVGVGGMAGLRGDHAKLMEEDEEPMREEQSKRRDATQACCAFAKIRYSIERGAG
jgi:hypothetical protein